VLLGALSDAQKTGIGLMGAAFIVFALVSSFVLPRRWPNFPGRYVWPYVGVVICFFLAMMAVIVWVAKEPPEQAEASAPSPPAAAPPPPAAQPPPAAKGDPAAGKAVFLANGCGSCHTFKPAGSSGTVGPDLDELAANAQKANRGSLEQYVHESIVDPNAYVVSGFQAGVMPQDFGQKLNEKQIADLVAFLTQAASG
jgi:mono/diheme cytochrome c family protein